MEVKEEDDERQKHSLTKIVTKLEGLLRANPIKTFNESGPNHINSFDWNNVDHRTAALSCLVKGVYKLEQERQEYLRSGLNPEPQDKLWWEFFNFTLTETLKGPKDGSIYGAIFDNTNYPNTPHSKPPPPRQVIAFRGTMLKRESLYRDLILDFRCFLDSLHRSTRFKHALNVIQSTVDTLSKKSTVDKTGNVADVWLAGHSLGAAMVLLAGKMRTKSKLIPLESHLFNPPFLSIPLETLVDSEILKHGFRFAGSLVKAGVAKALRDKHHHKDQDEDSCNRLVSWIPYFYLNPSDWFCSEYIGYFEDRRFMSTVGAENIGKSGTKNSSIGLIKQVVKRVRGSSSQDSSSEPLHLLPSAHLKINTYNCGTCHEIDQWWDRMCNGEFVLHQF